MDDRLTPGERVSRGEAPKVMTDDKGKLVLPPLPPPDDLTAQCKWLPRVLALDAAYPIIGGEWQGQRGPDGHVALCRAGAPEIRFEPARTMSTAMKLSEAFIGRRVPGDGPLPGFKTEHCRIIALVAGEALRQVRRSERG